MNALHSFLMNHVKYANMEGFCRDSHKLFTKVKNPNDYVPYNLRSSQHLEASPDPLWVSLPSASAPLPQISSYTFENDPTD